MSGDAARSRRAGVGAGRNNDVNSPGCIGWLGGAGGGACGGGGETGGGETGRGAAAGTSRAAGSGVDGSDFWNRLVNSPGGGLGFGPCVDSTRPVEKLTVRLAGSGAAETASVASGCSGAGAMAPVGFPGAGNGNSLASSHSGKVVSPGRNSLTITRPLDVDAISTIRARSPAGSAATWVRNRSAASASGPSRMCTMTGRPLAIS